MTGFNNITNSDHCGLYLDLQAEVFANLQTQSTTPPFENIEQDQCEKEGTILMQRAGARKLTSLEKKN